MAFNGFLFTTDQSPRGGKFRLLGLEGWHSVNLRRDRAEKAQQSGAWESTGFTSSLPITARGQAVYPDAESAALERREILALAGGGQYQMAVGDALGEGTRIVECDSLVVSPVQDRMFTWSLVVTACDPLLYGPPTYNFTGLATASGGAGLTYPLTYPLDYGVTPGTTPGAMQALNAGTASYYPRLRIEGPVTNPVVTLAETGDRIAYRGTIAAGQWLDIDCGARRVLLNGQVSMRHLVSAQGNWCAIPVRGGSLSWTADTADPAATLSFWAYEGAWL